ncbi:MAG: SDR family NAD(P)-dependent oxidoreductase [Clostridiales bacterium]|nr:SDR family NAD(P)-dependent oxidoreductase [Clostridiales bacterium]
MDIAETMNKVACVVGAAGGLGSCFAEVCLQKGYRVIGGDREDNAKTSRLTELHGERFFFRTVNIGNPDSVAAFADWAKQSVGHIDLLLNAAGMYTPNSDKLFEEFDIEQSFETYNINALGPLRIIQQLIPLVAASQDKVVINISSEAASMSAPVMLPWRYDYGMAKAALNLATTTLQRHYKPQGVKFLLLHPGWMRTDMGGPNAMVDPMDSASGIFSLADYTKHRLDDSIFFDYNGTPRPW